ALWDDEALALVGVLAGDALGLTAAGLVQGLLGREGVLDGGGHALDAAQGVGVALGEAWAPEGVLLRARQHGGCVHAVEAERARVPAGGSAGDVAGRLGDDPHRRVVGGGGGGGGGGVP